MKLDGKPVKMELKGLPVTEIKVVDEANGIIEAYVSIFNNVDSYGDVVLKGAFADSIKAWFPRYPKGVWGHDWNDPIAKTLEIREDERGLYIKGQLIMEVQRAKEAYALIKAGVMTDFSFGYEVNDYEIDFDKGIRYLKKLTIFEWSPVLVGANNRATLLAVKSQEQEIGEEEQPRTEAGKDPETPAADPVPDAQPVAPEPPATDDDMKGAENMTEFLVHDRKEAGNYFELKLENGESRKFKLDEGSAKRFAELMQADSDVKAGRVLSAATIEKIKTALDGYSDLVASANSITKILEDLLKSVEEPDDGKAAAGETTKVGQPGSKANFKLLLKEAQVVAKSNQRLIVKLKPLAKE